MTTARQLADAVGARLLGDRSGADLDLTGATIRAQDCGPGILFAALPGTRVHGASFGATAVEAGAAAVRTWGAGSTGSRLVTGSTRLHGELEDALADAPPDLLENARASLATLAAEERDSAAAVATATGWRRTVPRAKRIRSLSIWPGHLRRPCFCSAISCGRRMVWRPSCRVCVLCCLVPRTRRCE